MLLVAMLVPFLLKAQSVKVITNHVGYEINKAKHAILLADSKISPTQFVLVDEGTGNTVYKGQPVFSGPVDQWKKMLFWTIDFSNFQTAGTYRLQVSYNGKMVSSFPFITGKKCAGEINYIRCSVLFQRATELGPA